MSNFNVKGAFLVVASILVLFGGIELYGLMLMDNWSILTSTVFWQLCGLTVAVAPMMYGLIFDSEHAD